MCPIYSEIDALTSTAQIYFITAINAHTISTCKTIERNQAKVLVGSHILENCFEEDSQTDDFDENHSNCERIASKAQQQQRSIVIDYRKPKQKHIPVLLPSILNWLLALSISLSLFLYECISSDERMCGLMLGRSYFLLRIFSLCNFGSLDRQNKGINNNCKCYYRCDLYIMLNATSYGWNTNTLIFIGCILHFAMVIIRPLIYRRFMRVKQSIICCMIILNNEPKTINFFTYFNFYMVKPNYFPGAQSIS